MKTNRQIRLEALKRVLTGKWFGRILLVMMLLGFINEFANRIVSEVYKACEIQTWFDYLLVKVQSLAAGVDCAIPSRAIMVQMNHSTAFAVFIAFIFSGIALFGTTAVVLKTAKSDENSWFRGSFAGFARPLGLAWLGFLLFVRVALWSLLLVVPGIVASYRYSQSWNIKVEHPDWGASRCIAESSQMMQGYKLQRFFLDMYFLVIIAVLGIIALAMFELLPNIKIVMLPMSLIVGISSIFICMWISVARAVFYTELPKHND